MVRLETFFLGLFAAGVLVGFVACAEVEFGSTVLYDRKNYEKVVPPNMVDILVVVDNSGSMADEQTKLRQGFNGFLSYLSTSGFNYKVGVVTTYLDSNPSANQNIRTGNFYEVIDDIKNNETNICPSLGCPPQNMQQARLYGKERGIERAIAAIKGNRSFFRDQAELVVIFLSDEDSGCEYTDYDNFICEQYFSDHQNADDLMQAVKSRFGNDKHFTAHSIVDTGNSACVRPRVEYETNNPSIGKLYMEGSSETGGQVACIYTDDYDNVLRNIAEDIAVRSIQLECEPYENIDEEKCFELVLPDDYESNEGHPYVEGNKLILDPPLTSGQVISLEYWCTNYQHSATPNPDIPCVEN